MRRPGVGGTAIARARCGRAAMGDLYEARLLLAVDRCPGLDAGAVRLRDQTVRDHAAAGPLVDFESFRSLMTPPRVAKQVGARRDQRAPFVTSPMHLRFSFGDVGDVALDRRAGRRLDEAADLR